MTISKTWLISGISIIALAASIQLAQAAQNLQGIELNATALETRIILKSGTRIANKVISESAKKIVIDLDSVDPTRAIPTDFATAENIDQVILKPLAGDKLRLIIRGENLGSAVISTQNPLASTRIIRRKPVIQATNQPLNLASATPNVVSATAKSVAPKAAKVVLPGDSGYALTALATDPKATEKPVTPATATAPTTVINNPKATAAGDEPLDLTIDDTTSDTTVSSEESADIDSQGLVLPADETAPREALYDASKNETTTDLSEDDEPSTWIDALTDGLWGILRLAKGLDRGLAFALFALTGLLIAGTLLARRIFGQKRSIFDLQDDRPVNRAGRQQRRLFDEERPVYQDTRASYRGERPVGLGRIQPEAPTRSASYQNHALNEYSRQASPAIGQPRGVDRQSLDRTLRQSIQQRQGISKTQTRKPYANPGAGVAQNGPIQRPQQPTSASRPAPSSKPAAPAQKGLPGSNTEVLDFLRSVADLMEKDGQGQRANGLKRSIASQRPPV